MKTIHLIFILLYVITTIYLAVLNWEIFSVDLTVQLGFSEIKIPLVASLVLFGLLILLIQWGLVNVGNLLHERDLVLKDNELYSGKAALSESREREIQRMTAVLESVNSRLSGISEALNIENIEKHGLNRRVEKDTGRS